MGLPREPQWQQRSWFRTSCLVGALINSVVVILEVVAGRWLGVFIAGALTLILGAMALMARPSPPAA